MVSSPRSAALLVPHVAHEALPAARLVRERVLRLKAGFPVACDRPPHLFVDLAQRESAGAFELLWIGVFHGRTGEEIRTASLYPLCARCYTHSVITSQKGSMETKIIAIGNSKGVRLPKAALEECKLGEGDSVRLYVRGRAIVIAPRKNPREGWAESFRRGRPRKPENLWGDLPLDEGWDR